jgi:hypothetical protein
MILPYAPQETVNRINKLVCENAKTINADGDWWGELPSNFDVNLYIDDADDTTIHATVYRVEDGRTDTTEQVYESMAFNNPFASHEVTQAMNTAGIEIANALVSASCRKSMGGLGDCKEFNLSDYPMEYQDIIAQYLDEKIDSVTAIYIAMHNASKN